MGIGAGIDNIGMGAWMDTFESRWKNNIADAIMIRQNMQQLHVLMTTTSINKRTVDGAANRFNMAISTLQGERLNLDNKSTIIKVNIFNSVKAAAMFKYDQYQQQQLQQQQHNSQHSLQIFISPSGLVPQQQHIALVC